MPNDVMYIVMLVNFWEQTKWEYECNTPAPLVPFTLSISGTHSTSGSVGYVEIFDDYEKALEAAGGDTAIIYPVGKKLRGE